MQVDVNTSTPLCELMGYFGSDKGHRDITKCWHNYTTLYHSLFKDICSQPLRLFELGLGTNNTNIPSNMGKDGKPGASLFAWKEYFKNGMIYGADIDRDILFSTERIKTFYCDQTNPESIATLWKEPPLTEGFDIIIEDGLHAFNANVCFFENSIHKLNVGGYYIIEDIAPCYIANFEDILPKWRSIYPDLTFTLLMLPSMNSGDNNLVVIKRNA